MNEWIDWHGGECPVKGYVFVDVKFRDGDRHIAVGRDLRWTVSEHYADIVSWRLFTNNSVEESSEEPLQIVDNVNTFDNVNNPSHYTSHKSGTECIEITRHMSFNLGNATKYIWRCDLKKDAIEDLRKAIFYLNDEIELRLKLKEPNEKL